MLPRRQLVRLEYRGFLQVLLVGAKASILNGEVRARRLYICMSFFVRARHKIGY